MYSAYGAIAVGGLGAKKNPKKRELKVGCAVIVSKTNCAVVQRKIPRNGN